MTKKDYDLIAACIGNEQADNIDSKSARRCLDSLSYRLTCEFRLENPKFNEAIFWDRVEYWRKVASGEEK